jgi:phosphoglycerate dehydrogenase-like enzyme
MKPDAWLINTSRGPLVDEAALIHALQSRILGGPAVDVFDCEPPPEDHPFRTLDTVLATPHIGHVAEDDLLRTFFSDSAATVATWLSENP